MLYIIVELKSIEIGSKPYGSQQSQTTRNSFVVANWAGSKGSVAGSSGCDDVRAGQNC